MRSLDLADALAVSEALQGIDYVFHCAYDAQAPAWNLTALQALIAGCITHGCRLVHVSSYVVYDLPMAGEIAEDSPATPAEHGYAHNKLEAEHIVLKAVNDQGLLGTVIQPTIVYGPHSRPWTIDPADMLRHGVVVLPDRGEGLCNAVYVDDVVSALILAATHRDATGQRFLISGPEPVTWATFYETIAQSIGANGPRYLSAATIKREAAPLRKLLRLARDPEGIMRRLSKAPAGQKLIEACIAILPPSLRRKAHQRAFSPDAQRRGYVHMPNLGHLQFLSSNAIVTSAEAKRLLHCNPQFEFIEGMAATESFLLQRVAFDSSIQLTSRTSSSLN